MANGRFFFKLPIVKIINANQSLPSLVDNLFDEMLNIIAKANAGDLIFANFVEFDTLYGHRRDLSGYARAVSYTHLTLPTNREV